MLPELSDGRLRKGAARRAALLDATVRVVGRAGIAAVTQRAVAAEAGLPPSAVLYYFATVDELLVGALVAVNDRYLDALAALPDEPAAAIDALAALITAPGTEQAVAECELFLMALRRPDLRVELARWWEGLDAVAARLVVDPVGRAAFAAGVDGLFLRAPTLDVRAVRQVLARLAGCATAPAARP